MELRAEEVSRTFQRGNRELTAVNRVSLTLTGGTLTVLRGRSGSGKTTLLNILAGLQTPSSGRVVFTLDAQQTGRETELYRLGEEALSMFRNEHFGIVPQGQSAVDTLTVKENILFPGTIYGRKKQLSERAEMLMEQMGIPELGGIRPGELSGGQLRRMAIARALIGDPQVLYADEPTSDLDDDNRDLVLSILRKTADEGKAVLLVTHERAAEAYADCICRMDGGFLERI